MVQDDPLGDIRITNGLSDRLRAGVNIYQRIEQPDTGKLNLHIEEKLRVIPGAFERELPPGFTFSRKLYRDVHIDPTRNRPSSEALWRRLKNKGDFPRVNPFVDLTNLLSLTFQICFGLYDLEKIAGDITLTLGDDSDHYGGIGKDILHMKGKIVLKDSQGAFGNPSSDSSRTRVNSRTSRIMQVLFFHKQDPRADELTREASRAFHAFFHIGFSRSFLI
jgi:DNA/RNA-binding domain of Phe-tRNA-synthetase-like protein